MEDKTEAYINQIFNDRENELLLNDEIVRYVNKGYVVTSRTNLSAQMTKRKKFHFLLFIVFLLLGGFPGFLYLIWYLFVMKDDNVYLYYE